MARTITIEVPEGVDGDMMAQALERAVDYAHMAATCSPLRKQDPETRRYDWWHAKFALYQGVKQARLLEADRLAEQLLPADAERVG